MTDHEKLAAIAASRARTEELHRRADELEAETRQIRAQVWDLATYILKNERLTPAQVADVLAILKRTPTV